MLPMAGSHIPVSYFRSGDAIRSRSVSGVVLAETLPVPALPARLVADWARETSLRLGLEPGDVEALSLPRARARWPLYRNCLQAASDWTGALGLPDILATSAIALMACRGANYHHDGAHYGNMVFCNLFVSADKGLDLHFPHTGHRIALVPGTAVIFDTGQPHAVIARAGSGFSEADFPSDRDCTQVFLSWELPVANATLRQLLGIDLEADPSTALRWADGQVWFNGKQATVCPDSGRWRQIG
jgi:hypothetical protein